MRRTCFTLALLLLLTCLPVSARSAGLEGTADAQLPEVGSETAVLMDADTGQILYQKDMDRQMYPASITKIMTGMLALKYGHVTDTVTMSKEAVSSVDRDSANIALFTGEQLPLEEALYALAIASANDAANGIAELIGGSMEGFVAMMNDAAESAGAVNTHFTNANGLPDLAHFTTAHDMALITAQALKTTGFTEFFSAKRHKIPPTNKQPETRIINSSNRFLNGDISYDGLLMSKVGLDGGGAAHPGDGCGPDGTTAHCRRDEGHRLHGEMVGYGRPAGLRLRAVRPRHDPGGRYSPDGAGRRHSAGLRRRPRCRHV